MAGLQIQEGSGKAAPDVAVTAKGRSLLGTGGGAVPVSPTDEPILVRGNLQKLGKRFKGWHQRYFEIQGSHMYYYKNASKKECLGEINLTICFSCEPTTAASFGSPFEIKTVQRSHVLAARSKEEMQQWIQVIKERMSPSESEAKKGTGKKDTAKKSSKPKRWESFKGAFAIKQRSQSPAPLDTRERKKVQKKTFMDRFKVKRSGGGANQLTLAPEDNKRPLSFTGADEKSKDTLDVFAQFEVSKSLPSSPVSKKKKHSLPSRESPPPLSPMSMSSGSPFTGGATTEDSQHSTPSHIGAAAPVHDQDVRTQQQAAPSSTVVGQEIQIKVDVEDTPPTPIPTIIEPSETVETGETATNVDAQSKPTEPIQPENVTEQEQESTNESPVKKVETPEPVDAIQKDVESVPTESVEQASSGTAQESPTKPAEPEDSNVIVETEANVEEDHKSPDETPEPPATDIPKQSDQSPSSEQIEVEEKEPEVPVIVIEERKSEKPALPTKPAVVVTAEGKPALPVKPTAAVKEKDTDPRKSEKPSLPVKPSSAKTKEAERKSAKPSLPAKPATVLEKEPELVSSSSSVVVEKEKTKEPPVPKYLKDRKFLWDRIQEVLETAEESTEDPSSYSELPPLEATWAEHSSPVEQLRAFLMVCP